MIQQLIAIIVIVFFVLKLFWQKKYKKISNAEFSIWIIFWIIALFAIIFIKDIDALLFKYGFSGTGIEILFYTAVIILFYYIINLRIRLEKIERNITKIIREITLRK